MTTPASIKEEFEKVFKKEFHMLGNYGRKEAMIYALWAAKWMAKRCADKVEGIYYDSNDRTASSEIRQLAKELR